MRIFLLVILIILGIPIITLSGCRVSQSAPPTVHFEGLRAYQDVLAQVAFGPRIPASQAHAKTIAYIKSELEKAGWQAKIQDTNWNGFPVQNIIAARTDQAPQIILGAHYDSRLVADKDTGPGRNSPVPGANDGASGVAVLLELSRVLPQNSVPTWLVFFDSEDNGGLGGREWSMGSRAFVAELKYHPRAAVVVDMIGDTDLNIYIERNSNSVLAAEIWRKASKLGYGNQFIKTAKYSIIDDHTPFLEAGIPAVDIIDINYPFWHTTEDTPDKVSPKSLKIVGETLLAWMNDQR